MDVFKDLTDDELVVSYLDGNNLAFDELLLRHNRGVYKYIYFIVKNKELSEDIFQETFIKAIVNLKQGKYAESGKFRPWLVRIAHNLVIDHFRQKKSMNTISNDDLEIDLFNNVNLSDGTIEDYLVYNQIIMDVRKLISSLPENQREVLEMRYYQDLSFKEIADRTGISINTALGRMRYAILNMRKLAEEYNIVLSVY